MRIFPAFDGVGDREMPARQHIGMQFLDQFAIERFVTAAQHNAGLHIEVERFKKWKQLSASGHRIPVNVHLGLRRINHRPLMIYHERSNSLCVYVPK